MKVILTIIIVGIYINCYSQWTKQPVNFSNDLFSVFCINADTVIAVGEAGAIARTTDGGNHWYLVDSYTSSCLRKVAFKTPNQGYIVGDNCIFLKTVDYGETWSIINLPYQKDLLTIYFQSELTGYIGGDSILLKTIDGGTNWYEITPEITSSSISTICFPSADTGYLATLTDIPELDVYNEIMKTTDGGISWQQVKYPLFNKRTIHFYNNNIGFCGGVDGSFHHTYNGGLEWYYNDFTPHIDCFDSFSIDSITYVVGWEYMPDYHSDIAKTSDYCSTWAITYHVTNEGINSIHFANDSVGYVVGNNGFIMKTKYGEEYINTPQINYDNNATISIYPDPVSTNSVIYYKVKQNNNYSICIYSISGDFMKIYELFNRLNEGFIQVNNTGYNNGIYYCILMNERQIIKSIKFIYIKH